MKNKLSFNVIIFPQQGSLSGGIEIEVRSSNSITIDPLVLISWAWQSKPERPADKPLGIFAFKLKIKTRHIEDFEASVRVSRRILKKIGYDKKPENAIKVLLSMGAREVVNDSRVGQPVTLDDVKGPEYSRFIDDYSSLGTMHCMFGVLATSEIEAKALILIKATESQLGNVDWIEKFMKAEMPVMVDRYGKYPDTTSGLKRLEDLGLIDKKEGELND